MNNKELLEIKHLFPKTNISKEELKDKVGENSPNMKIKNEKRENFRYMKPLILRSTIFDKYNFHRMLL